MIVWLFLLLIPSIFAFNESLELTPLPQNKLLAQWTFDLASSASNLKFYNETDFLDSTEHYNEFPRALGPIVQLTNTRELHLRFGQGYWDYDIWGGLPENGDYAGGPGVELWATIEAPNVAAARRQWAKLTNSLSGFFCASLNVIDSLITSFPRNHAHWSSVNDFNSFENSYLSDPTNKLYLLRAALPSEPVCTENLTPFLKLLPTRGKLGIASLLEGHRVFDLLWHSMLIDLISNCIGSESSKKCLILMRQKVTTVVDVLNSLRKKNEGGIPRPVLGDKLRCDTSKVHDLWQCFPLPDPQDLLYSLEDILGRRIKGAAFSDVYLKIIIDAPYYDVNFITHSDDGWAGTVLESNGAKIEYNIDGSSEYDFKFDAKDAALTPANNAAPIQVARSLTGYSLDNGGLRVSFSNPANETAIFTYYEVLPWFMRLYLHTLVTDVVSLDDSLVTVTGELLIKSRYYRPAIDRARPSHLEFLIELPANTRLTLNYQFDKSLLLYSEYPPDANHGFPIAPAVITVLNDGEKSYELRTTSLLVTLPTPDFLMPYNVIILTSTVMALVFGLVFNLLIRRIITEEELDAKASKLKLSVLIAKIKSKFNKTTK